MKRNQLITFLAGWLVVGVPASGAAEAPVNTPAQPSTAGGITVLSPFTVDSTRDRGYQAENTLSGSRLNSSLRDIPASVSVMTPEFIRDVGLDGLAELMAYSVNSQVFEHDTSSSSGADAVNGLHLVRAIDTRGVRSSQGLDYFGSITPDDSYRVARYDDSRGPNSILFGISQAGGLINQTS